MSRGLNERWVVSESWVGDGQLVSGDQCVGRQVEDG